MKPLLKAAALLVAIALQGSCASSGPEETQEDPLPQTGQSSAQETDAADTGSATTQATASDSRDEVIIESGEGQFLNLEQATDQDSQDADNNIDIDFDNTSLTEFIRLVLGDVLGLNFVIDPNVSGTVTLHTASPLNEADLLNVVEQVLAMNNAALVRRDNLYQVLPAAAARSAQVSPSASGDNNAGYAVEIIPLEFIAASEIPALLEPVVSDMSNISIDETRNLIIATGTQGELRTIRETINIFDVDWLRGMSLGLFPLENVDPQTLEEELREILDFSDDNGTLGGLVRLVPLDRLSSLLVVSSTASALREVESWINRLDQPNDTSGNSLYVYEVQNAKAVDLAATLGNIFSVSGLGNTGSQESTGRPSAQGNGTVAPGLEPAQIGNNNATNNPGDGTSSGNLGQLPFSDNIRIIADDVRNSLVIMADSQSYQMIESALKKLDTVPLQVMIEASILEVSLRDDLSYGVEWFFKNSVENGEFDGIGTLDLGDSGISALAPGFSYTVIDSASQVRVALNALATESEINVLSSPSLMVLDNQTATINVGDEIPVPTRQSISNIDPISPTVNEISFRQTGITLTVSPRVNNSGLVTMDILQEVATAATTTTSNLDAPTIQNRMIESVVAINSGETIILGGLMLEQESTSGSGMPLLKDIPLFGALFSQNTNEKSRTELLVLITPRVVRNQVDARGITDEYRSRLQSIPPLTPIEPQAEN